ncbi:nucleotidyltransferase family protein [Fuchsiella alkaliacetigena]|uniref:nucleotidyltransferase family protein n=1 Tax=Fuchsiella alkaliacetigena TaxID=957042 RepID=UPI00200A9267|nr:nucleotidyltransferase domain-containing protein [Fuchsiella alkaliacetigena]MCK8824314.1 nucleotidyltransferase domain-containing protein [Fuchsiella alkaliacetigena]
MSGDEEYPLLFADEEEEQRKLEQRYQRALTAARKAAELLKEEYGAEQVWIFGSLAEQERFNKWSDIDLAARGIAPEKFYAAVGAVTGLVEEFKVDLIDIDDCKESLAETVENEGVEV